MFEPSTISLSDLEKPYGILMVSSFRSCMHRKKQGFQNKKKHPASCCFEHQKKTLTTSILKNKSCQIPFFLRQFCKKNNSQNTRPQSSRQLPTFPTAYNQRIEMPSVLHPFCSWMFSQFPHLQGPSLIF